MSKPKRGSNAKKIADWRGTCQSCNKKRVKILWTSIGNGKTLRVCKRCGE